VELILLSAMIVLTVAGVLGVLGVLFGMNSRMAYGPTILHRFRTRKKSDYSMHQVSTMRPVGFDHWLDDALDEGKDDRPEVHFVPLRVYLPDPVPAKTTIASLVNSLQVVATMFGFAPTGFESEESGSFLKTMWLKTLGLLRRHEVKNAARKFAQALEVQGIDEHRAAATKAQAEAFAAVATAMDNVDAAAVQVGSLVYVKSKTPDGRTVVTSRSMSEEELRALESKQTVMEQFRSILALPRMGIPLGVTTWDQARLEVGEPPPEDIPVKVIKVQVQDGGHDSPPPGSDGFGSGRTSATPKLSLEMLSQAPRDSTLGSAGPPEINIRTDKL
jgi:hypothetical protein